jgi:hypothetical protein
VDDDEHEGTIYARIPASLKNKIEGSAEFWNIREFMGYAML